jgi:benzodiazapine receptor
MLIFLLCLLPPAFAMSMGAFFKPGSWYRELILPWWTPPDLAFPIVWSVLYFLMAITLFILYSRRELRSFQGLLFLAQLILNALWSPVFFGFHQILIGLLILSGILVSLISLIRFFWKDKQVDQAILLFPYFCWVCIAFSLNCSIYIHN